MQDPARKQATEQYEAALRLMQEGKFERAHAGFEKLLENGSAGLTDMHDRVRVHMAACHRQIATSATATEFRSLEEQFDYAVSLLNVGQYDEAREHLEAILAQNDQADYAWYGLAALAGMTGQTDACLEYLERAIQLNPRNRLQARTDPDFQEMNDDPRFTDLLYPETSS